jgi:hypothetical protein
MGRSYSLWHSYCSEPFNRLPAAISQKRRNRMATKKASKTSIKLKKAKKLEPVKHLVAIQRGG